MLCLVDPLLQFLKCITREYPDRLLGKYLSMVHFFVNEVHGDARQFNAVRESLTDRVPAWEGWEEGRVDIDDPPPPGGNESR